MITVLIPMPESNLAQYESIYSEIINWCIDNIGPVAAGNNGIVNGEGWQFHWIPKRRAITFEKYDSFRLCIENNKIGLIAMLKFGNKD
jgi:hypothetical protein